MINDNIASCFNELTQPHEHIYISQLSQLEREKKFDVKQTLTTKRQIDKCLAKTGMFGLLSHPNFSKRMEKQEARNKSFSMFQPPIF